MTVNVQKDAINLREELNALRAMITQPFGYGVYGGSANAITVSADMRRMDELEIGTQLRFRATAANTGATTINVNGLGAITALTPTGAALPSGYIRTDVDTVMSYDGTNWIVSRAIEKGSNSDGEYVRYEDGTQICYNRSVTLYASGQPLSDTLTTWTFPIAFVNTHYNVSAQISGVAVSQAKRLRIAGIEREEDRSASAVDIFIEYVSLTGAAHRVTANARGRWY